MTCGWLANKDMMAPTNYPIKLLVSEPILIVIIYFTKWRLTKDYISTPMTHSQTSSMEVQILSILVVVSERRRKL